MAGVFAAALVVIATIMAAIGISIHGGSTRPPTMHHPSGVMADARAGGPPVAAIGVMVQTTVAA